MQTCVSIHASSREDATPKSKHNDSVLCFNPRVLAGGRDMKHLYHFPRTGFQSTRPRGRTRLNTRFPMPSSFCFNPRVLAGGRDVFHLQALLFHHVSIHASSREDATPEQCGNKLRIPVSIHASSREDATSSESAESVCGTVSIHASSREDATSKDERGISALGFNPRVLAGGRDRQVTPLLQRL